MAHLIQQIITDHFKIILPQIRRLEYFSDGCAGQYKNKKNFCNLCQHNKDFGSEGTWNFFATSHKKSTCDGICGTVKRVTARSGFQRSLENHIITPPQCSTFVNQLLVSYNYILFHR